MSSHLRTGEDDARSHEPIAVVGFAFEFPEEATSDEAFWQMICQGRSASKVFPKDRLNIDGLYNADTTRHNTIPVRGANFLREDLGVFDAPFFSISPLEAACMDPQHRRMLEVSYHALENAGITMESCCGSDTTVYTGTFCDDYHSILQKDPLAEQRHAALGIASSMLANRVSWFYNFKGASINLDTACSSSLTGLHLAHQDLKNRAASMALVGGSNLVFHPNFMRMMSNFNFLSPDSRSWSFDERANGYARGEGVAVIVLKRLSDALRDGDTIRAVIQNTAINQDGRTPGITQPSQEAQVDLIRTAYQQVGADMKSTRYFEAHGTGTLVGDPIEARAIGKAFASSRTEDDPLYVGAVKANIGHLEGCSGLASVIKTILVLERGIIPPIAGFETLNHNIDSHELRLHFPKEKLPWPSEGLRRACVNSFGFGGTNVLVLLDDAYHYLQKNRLRGHFYTWNAPLEIGKAGTCVPHHNGQQVARVNTGSMENLPLVDGMKEQTITTLPRLLVWSAGDKAGIQQLARAYRGYLYSSMREIDNLAFTLSTRRDRFQYKSFATINPSDDATLAQFESVPPMRSTESKHLAFVFTGQGSQYIGMGRQLLAYPAFKNSLMSSEQCLRLLNCSWSLRGLFNSSRGEIPIDQPEYSQTLITCLQIALLDLLEDVNVVPTVVIGHSSGEIAAAYACGALSRESAVKVAYHRGRLSSEIAKSTEGLGMMAVNTSKTDCMVYLSKLKQHLGTIEVSVGCVNGFTNVTLTGKATQLDILEQWFNKEGILARRLQVPVAYHSAFMNAIADDYYMALGKVEQGRCLRLVNFLSTVTGSVVDADHLSRPDYWVQNLTSTVEFQAALSKIVGKIKTNRDPRRRLGIKSPIDLRVGAILEIGPQSTLKGPVNDCLQPLSVDKRPSYCSLLKRGEDAVATFLTTMGTLYCTGYPVNVSKANFQDLTPKSIPPGMPKYPFNHSRRYWEESRLSRQLRFRKHPPHELLGIRSTDWNPQVAKWRCILRLSEISWLEDHTVHGECVLPAAAALVMAIEALKQLHSKASPSAIEMKEVSFTRAVNFKAGVGKVEAQMNVSTFPTSATSDPWSHFRLFIVDNDEYIECCNGLGRVLEFSTQDDDGLMPTPTSDINMQPWIDHAPSSCHLPMSREEFMEMSDGVGVHYGPSFLCLEALRLGEGGKASAEIKTDQWRIKAGDHPFDEYVLHPATLDGLAQLILPAFSELKRKEIATMVPSYLAHLRVDCRCRDMFHKGRIRATAECKPRGYRGVSANIFGTSINEQGRTILALQGFETAFISSSNSSTHSKTDGRNLCMRIVQKPDIGLMSHKQVWSDCVRRRPNEVEGELELFRSLSLAILTFIDLALEYIATNPTSLSAKHYHAYVGWMQLQSKRGQTGQTAAHPTKIKEMRTNQKAREHLFSQVTESGVKGHFFMTVGRNLLPILRGETSPLDLYFSNGLVDKYYEHMLANEYHAHPVKAYLDLLSFQNPSMNILEVGAGTGGQTMPSLQSLSSGGIRKWARFDYTDISAGFFSQAESKFGKFAADLNFCTLDIEKDPLTQGFEASKYDLIIASHVLHATLDLNQCLRNIRKLLKPNGKFLFVETVHPECLHIGFAFGLLPGWWAPLDHEDRSLLSPCLDAAQWDRLLRGNGFSGVDIQFDGQQEPMCRFSSILVSTAVEYVNGPTPTESVAIVRNHESKTQCLLSELLVKEFESCKSYTLEELAEGVDPTSSPAYTNTLFLLEVDADFLDEMPVTRFELIRNILLKSKTTLWLSRSESGKIRPQHHLVDGLGRALNSEDSDRKFVTLSIEDESLDLEQIADTTAQVLTRNTESHIEDLENNYVVTQGGLKINRITQNLAMDKVIGQKVSTYRHERHSLEPESRFSLHLGMPGALDSLEFQEDKSINDYIGSEEVVVEVKAFGLSQRDYLTASGQLNEVDIGTECSGVVKKAGTNSPYQPGDSVCLIGTSMSRTTVLAKRDMISRIPNGLSLSEAASIPCALWMSYYALVEVARLRAGETILIHKATGGTGQMAIQIAQKLGARVLTTCSSSPRKEYLRHQFGIDYHRAFSSIDILLPNKVRAATGGNGVDVIFGSLSDGSNIDFLECLASFGRLIDTTLEKRPGADYSTPTALPKNISQSRIDMAEFFKRKPIAAGQIFQDAKSFAKRAKFAVPGPLHYFTANDIEAAFRHFQDKENFGKRIVKLDPGTSLDVKIITKPKYFFNKSATYVISGGLGGLGRSFARWMVERGARNLLLLSRSGKNSDTARQLVAELESQGVSVLTPKCDVSNTVQLKRLLQNAAENMPPIKGCIQATVALRDKPFEKMTHDDWTTSTRAKVTASWNLHTLLPQDLDFFVILSSVNGIFGNRTQANYAAGNTFKDALAHYRVANGQKAVSIDLGLMVSEGVVAESESLLASIRRIGHLMDISQAELLALMDYYCDPDLPILSREDCQILVGIELPSAVLAKGIDLHHSIRRPMFRHLFRMRDPNAPAAGASAAAESELSHGAMLKNAESAEAASALVTTWFSAKLAHVLGLAKADVDETKPVHAYGVDSLVAIDLRNWLQREIGASIPVFELMSGSSIRELSAAAVAKSTFVKSNVAASE